MPLLLYFLIGGAAALTWLCALSIYITKQNLEISDKKIALKFKELAYERESSIETASFLKIMAAKFQSRSASQRDAERDADHELPQALKDLISSSPDHDEIQEIDEDDNLIGIVFDSTYPPEFSEND